MPPEPSRGWEAAFRDHIQDSYAHPPAWAQQKRYIDGALEVLETRVLANEMRLTAAERFRERIIGGLLVLGAILSGGLVAVIGEIIRLR